MSISRRWVWIVIALALGMLLAACGGDDNTGDGSDGSDGAPDLTVESIVVDPAQPPTGEPFTIRVTVKNQGEAESGSYDVTVSIRDVLRDEQFPVGTFNGDPITAGGDDTVYEGYYHGPDEVGSYQADSNTENNQQNKAFTVGE